MDAGIFTLVMLGLVVALGAALVFVLKGRVRHDVMDELMRGVAVVVSVLGAVYSEEDVRMIAGWYWDTFMQDGEYVGRDYFVELIVRYIYGASDIIAAQTAIPSTHPDSV